MLYSKRPKARTCEVCERVFVPDRMGQLVCRPACAMARVRQAKKAERASIKARKEAIKPRAKWLAECQAIVNKIVRLRDRHLPCCSCDRPASWDGQWHASHLRSVGAASAVRFNLWNIHKGCSVCNNHLSGNLAEYLPRIRARIGDDKVDWLYRQNNIASYDIDYLKRFKAVMGKKLRRMARTLADLDAHPEQLETHRPAIQSGLSAIERVLPSLDPLAIGVGMSECKRRIGGAGISTQEIDALLCG